MKQQINQTALLIYGMHRSGTSALAGLLNQAGIPMGDALMKAAHDNPKGFFENERLVAINKKILNACGQTWDSQVALPTNWEQLETVLALQKEAKQFLKREFKKTPVFALKDPRFSLTLPFWRTIFKKLKINIKQYVLVRHPYEIAASLFKRNQMPQSQALALWTKYMVGACEKRTAEKIQFIAYDAILEQPQLVLKSMLTDVNWQVSKTNGEEESFITKTLRNHYANQLITQPLQQRLYKLLLQLVEDAENEEYWKRVQAIQNSSDYKKCVPETVTFTPIKNETETDVNGTLQSKTTQKSTTNFWWQFLKTGFKSPMAFFKNINGENLKILQKALLNEPPSLILKNLKKKLLGTKQQASFDTYFNKKIDFQTVVSQLELPLKTKFPNGKLGNILYFSTNLPDFDTSSGGKRATRYLSLLTKYFNVYTYSIANQEEKYSTHLQQLGIEVLPTTDYAVLKKKVTDFKAIIASTYMIISEIEPLLQHYPNAQFIVDTVDVHWVREERSKAKDLAKIAENKDIEKAVYKQADMVWTVTEVDRQAILKEVPQAKIAIVSNIHEQEVTTYQASGNHDLLFFGSYRHLPNIAAIKELALTIFPKVRKAIPDARLIIAGSYAPREVIKLGDLEGVVYKGFIEETAIADLYQNIFLSVSPLLAGAGIKGKICEAIAYKTPIVTNDIGNEGIDLQHEKEGLIVPNDGMAETIIKACQNQYDFTGMTILAAQKMAALVGERVVENAMMQSIFPEVSICIVTWNRLELLQKCIASVFQNTNYPNYKILVYSNACTDGTVAYLKDLAQKNKRIIPFFSATNEVFVRPNNEMMRYFPQNEVVLLNNDTEVTENWLLELHRAAFASKNIGVAGGKILYPNGKLQEFGAALYEAGYGQNFGKGDDPTKSIYQQVKKVGYVSGCAMYIKRSTIEKIGVFDECFHPCYYEDSDFCYTAKENGLATIVTPHSTIYHKEGATAGTDTATGFKTYQAVNKEKFIQKHQGKNNGIFWTNQPVTSNQQPATSFIFTHIPKCGGTSFRRFINQAALANGIAKDSIFIPGENGIANAKNLEQLTPPELKKLKQNPPKVLANHSKYEEHSDLGIRIEHPFYYTILREPVQRFISHYNFFYYEQGLDGCKGIPFEQLAAEKQEYLIHKLANLQIRYLTNENPTDKVGINELYQKAQHNLQQHYAAFGILENMEQSIQQLKEVAPSWLQLTADFPILNKNKTQLSIPDNLVQAIEKANFWDSQLYEWAVEKVVLDTVDSGC